VTTECGAPVLEVRGLCVDYFSGSGPLRAVADVDLVLRRGEVLGLAGESGSGKSTLAQAAIRLLREPGVVTGGEVLLHLRAEADAADGAHPADASGVGVAAARPGGAVDLLTLGGRELRRVRWSQISIVPQSALNALNPVINVATLLDDMLKAHHRGERRERRQRAAELLEMVGISRYRLGSYPHELSGGQRQRVMIALALALEPQVVILDEPTTALDVVTQRRILEELARLQQELGFSMLFITHDLSLLIELADEIAVMYGGKIVERTTAQKLFASPLHPYSQGLLRSFPSLRGESRRMTGIPGAPPSLQSMPSGCAFHPRCPHAMARCSAEVPPLQSVTEADHEVACFLYQSEGGARQAFDADPDSLRSQVTGSVTAQVTASVALRVHSSSRSPFSPRAGTGS
jgi:peptide/nickel transport system ATP-binding protein